MRVFHVSVRNTSNEIIEHGFRRQVPKAQPRSLKGNTSESAESSRYGRPLMGFGRPGHYIGR